MKEQVLVPWQTFGQLLNRPSGISKKRFRRLLIKVRGWKDHDFIGTSMCLNKNIVVICDNGIEEPASVLVHCHGGEMPYCSIPIEVTSNKCLWKRMYKRHSSVLVSDVINFITSRVEKGKSTKPTRSERRRFRKIPIKGEENVSFLDMLCRLNGLQQSRVAA